jgi:hypothetical protein
MLEFSTQVGIKLSIKIKLLKDNIFFVTNIKDNILKWDIWYSMTGSKWFSYHYQPINKQTKAYKKYYKQNKVLKHMQIFLFIVK